jgi:D-inositol-3-phosphate glycosyltransferase
VRFEKPVVQERLADWYRAASLVVVPSHNESFGLVALEAQACGTPVIAAAVGGLRTAVRDGVSGLLVEGHDPGSYADAMARVLSAPHWRRSLGAGAVRHAAQFGWAATAGGVLASYEQAVDERLSSARPA